MKTRRNIYILIFTVLCFWDCEKYQIEEKPKSVLFPAGRSFLGTSEIAISLNESAINHDIMYDSCGGYWIKISETDLPEHGNLKIRFTRKQGELHLFYEENIDEQHWLDPSYYIDSDNEILCLKAVELTQGIESNINKAKIIHQYVSQNITLEIYKDSFLDKASKTYDLGYGTCMNYSRLYVALCRAADIPARTVWGMVYGYDDDNIYDYHHQWAEILDDSGYWHPADFNYTTNFDLNDIRYLDLIYAAEENTIVKNRIDNIIILKDLKYFNNYPATLTGRLGFQLIEDNRPSSMTVEYSYEF